MLTVYINTLGAGAEGYINLAGTPVSWRAAADQNLLRQMKNGGGSFEKVRDYIIKELEKAAKFCASPAIIGPSPPAVMFLASAPGRRHLEQLNPAALHLADGLPVLILQGEEDRQVTSRIMRPGRRA